MVRQYTKKQSTLQKKALTYGVGFNLYLEHLLQYDYVSEKAVMSTAPIVQLGGAWNAAKTFETLTKCAERVTVLGFSSNQPTVHGSVIENLLAKEQVKTLLLPLKERVLSSYYLIPEKGKTWAFGDSGSGLSSISKNILGKVRSFSQRSDIRFLSSVTADSREIELAREVFRRYKGTEKNILIPSSRLLKDKVVRELFPLIDILSLNMTEAKTLFGSTIGRKQVMRIPVPFVLITDGFKKARLKAGEEYVEASPRQIIKNPKYIAGAGDSATAALAYALFEKGLHPLESLKYALGVGTKTLTHIESHYIEN